MGVHRRGIAWILAVAAACLLAGGLGAYGAVTVLDRDAFADRALHTLDSDEIREEVGVRIGGRLASERPELSAGEPMIEDAVAEAVTGDPAFRAAFRDGAERLHAAIFDGGDPSLVVAGSGAMLHDELERRLPQASRGGPPDDGAPQPDDGAPQARGSAPPDDGARGGVPPLGDVPLFTLGDSGGERALLRAAPTAADLALPLSILLLLAGLGLLALAVAREPDHRRAVWGAGLAVAAAGGLSAAGVTAAQDIVLDNFDTGFGDAVVGGVWDAYLADLRMWALAVGAGGLVVAAAAGGPRPAPSTLLAAPASRGGRALRAAGLLAVAALAVQFPELVLHTGLVALAAGLVYVAAGDLLRVVAPPTCARRRLRAAALAFGLLGLIAVATLPV